MTKKLKVLELFAGTKSISRTFEAHGHDTYSVEWDEKHPDIDWYVDISKVTAQDILDRFGKPDVIWASFDCTSYSVAGIGHHRTKDKKTGNLLPKTDYAVFCDNTNTHVINLIKELNPTYYYIENPRGGLRKMDFMKDLPRYTVTYCKYGRTYMKPTDIWTNHPNPNFIPHCKNGDPCHEAAPRGSQTGVQAIKNKVDKSRIPELLCEHIVSNSEDILGQYTLFDITPEEHEIIGQRLSLIELRELLEQQTEDGDSRVHLMNFQEINASLQGLGYYAELEAGASND